MVASIILDKILKYSNLNAKAFSEKIGLDRPQAVYDIQKGKTKSISHAMMIKITSVFPELNKSWLLTGEGSMLKSNYDQAELSVSEVEESLESNYAPKKEHIIRYYDIQASAGGIGMYSDSKESYSNLIVPGFDDCDIALNVWGDSMEPILKSGEIVTMREWKEPFIDWGKIYLVVTNSGYRMIKYLKKSVNNDEVICESANPDHDPFPIKKSDIAKLYQIKGCISRYSI